MTENTTLLSLPLDILVLVFPYLDVQSFLNLCSTCKALSQPSIRHDSGYWGTAVQKNFRVPNQPVVQKDGQRLYHLYRRLLTQSRAFTWGSNSHGCLGHSFNTPQPPLVSRLGPNIRMRAPTRSVGEPIQMEGQEKLGIIADMQCGGWSTTLLNSKGVLHTIGVLNGERYYRDHNGQLERTLQPLKFPAGFPDPTERLDPYISVKQFSAGRSHILALSDSGRIWSWYTAQKPALHVKFLQTDILEDANGKSPSASTGRVRQVLAGWDKSSAYVTGVGIIYWDIVTRNDSRVPPARIRIPQPANPEPEEEADTMLVLESHVVPKTGLVRSSTLSEEDRLVSEEVGAVLNYIFLEGFILFITDIGKVFASRADGSDNPELVELKSLRCDLSDSKAIPDVQGTFRTFAVLYNGKVTIGDVSYLDRCWEKRHDSDFDQSSGLRRIPALQNNDVIQLAFGDYHFHALHSNGHITSYGKAPGGCGALGLGNSDIINRLRGVRTEHDQVLLSHAYTTGRRIWFDPTQRKWLQWLASGAKNPSNTEWHSALSNPEAQAELSEWIEQQSLDWDHFDDVKAADQDGLGSHFALRVSAAGWHSGAVGLVNDDVVKKVEEHFIVPDDGSEIQDPDRPVDDGLRGVEHLTTRRDIAIPEEGKKYKWVDEGFPKLKLSNGEMIPGDGPEVDWRFGKPNFSQNVQT